MPSTSANNTNCASSSPPSTMCSASSSAPVASPPPPQSDWAISNYDSRTTEAPDVERELRRLQNLKLYNLLDVPQPTCFQRYCQLACHMFQTSMSAVTLVDLGRLYIVAGHGFPASIEHIREVPRCVSFCAHTILSKNDVVVVPDASLDARFAHIPLVAGPAQTRFYAGANLITPPDPTTGTAGGQRLGCMTVLDSKPRHDWTEAHTALLQHLACMVMDLMEEQRKALIAVGSKQKQKHRQQQHTDAATHAIDQSAQRLSLHGGDRGRVDNDVDDSNNSNSNNLYKHNQHEHDNKTNVNVAEEKNSQGSFHALLGTEPSGTEPQLPTLTAPRSSSLFQQSLPTGISAAAARVVKHLHQVQQEQDQQPLHNHNDEVLSSYLGTRKALDDATYVLQSLLSFQSCHQQQEQQQQQPDAHHAATSIRTTNDMMWTATEPLVDNAHLEATTTSVLRSEEDAESASYLQQQPQQPAVSEKSTSMQWATELASDIFSSSQAPQPSRQSQQRVGIVCTVQVSTLLEHLNFVMQSYPSYASSAASASAPSSLSSSLLTRDTAVPIYFRMDPDMPQHIVLPDDLKVFRSSIALLASAYERTRQGYVRFSISCKERMNRINNNPTTTTATTQRMVVFECEDTGPNLTWEQYQDMVAPPPTAKRRPMSWSGGLHNAHHHDQWDDPSLVGNNSNSSNNHHIDYDSDHGTSSDADCIQVDPVTGQILKSSHCASLTVVASTLFSKEQQQQHQANTTDTSPSLNAAQSLTLDKKHGINHNTTIRHNRGDGCLPLSIHAVVKYIGSIPGGDYGFRPRNGDAGIDVTSSSIVICTNTTTTTDVATSPTTKTILTAPTAGSVFWFCFPLQDDIVATTTTTTNQD